ncbi:beta-class carbonic anhydrase [Streptomyces hokutonensis]|uniref:beta-class carbonic anhydrase n=1 Tax=Streptomyces hokutonensis TaxID=1306990 RepID=UPI00035CE9AE|nr:carbonic anhydrase [Streptomyces hokutonensis]
MSATEKYLANDQGYVSGFTGPLPMERSRHIANVACMDARLNIYGALGLREGEASVIRNAGGVITEDVIPSLTVSQQLLGTREIMLVHHTDCRMLAFPGYTLKEPIRSEGGLRPSGRRSPSTAWWPTCNGSISRIRTSPYIPHRAAVRGFVLDLATGQLEEVK